MYSFLWIWKKIMNHFIFLLLLSFSATWVLDFLKFSSILLMFYFIFFFFSPCFLLRVAGGVSSNLLIFLLQTVLGTLCPLRKYYILALWTVCGLNSLMYTLVSGVSTLFVFPSPVFDTFIHTYAVLSTLPSTSGRNIKGVY